MQVVSRADRVSRTLRMQKISWWLCSPPIPCRSDRASQRTLISKALSVYAASGSGRGGQVAIAEPEPSSTRLHAFASLECRLPQGEHARGAHAA